MPGTGVKDQCMYFLLSHSPVLSFQWGFGKERRKTSVVKPPHFSDIVLHAELCNGDFWFCFYGAKKEVLICNSGM